MRYEYGIKVTRPGNVHREGMTREEAMEWVEGWEEDGGKSGLFIVIRRAIGSWEEYKSGASA